MLHSVELFGVVTKPSKAPNTVKLEGSMSLFNRSPIPGRRGMIAITEEINALTKEHNSIPVLLSLHFQGQEQQTLATAMMVVSKTPKVKGQYKFEITGNAEIDGQYVEYTFTVFSRQTPEQDKFIGLYTFKKAEKLVYPLNVTEDQLKLLFAIDRRSDMLLSPLTDKDDFVFQSYCWRVGSDIKALMALLDKDDNVLYRFNIYTQDGHIDPTNLPALLQHIKAENTFLVDRNNVVHVDFKTRTLK